MDFTSMPCRVLHPNWTQVKVQPFQWFFVQLQGYCESKIYILVYTRLFSSPIRTPSPWFKSFVYLSLKKLSPLKRSSWYVDVRLNWFLTKYDFFSVHYMNTTRRYIELEIRLVLFFSSSSWFVNHVPLILIPMVRLIGSWNDHEGIQCINWFLLGSISDRV